MGVVFYFGEEHGRLESRMRKSMAVHSFLEAMVIKDIGL